ncbi:MAG: hypothetical protein ACFFD4_01815 [Candidatus Odinarchaeota archaeon]
MSSLNRLKTIIKARLLNSRDIMGDQSEPDEAPSGKALQLYWYLLTHGPTGIREIQKALKINSPSSVAFQVNKLVKNGIVSKNENDKYFIKEEIKSGILSFYLRFGYRMIPRFSVYLCIYLAGLLGFLLVLILEGDQFILNPVNMAFFLYLILGSGIFIYESVVIWKMKPRF